MSASDIAQLGLNILCIDGGGVRGLSALVLLQEIMHRIQHLEGLQSPPEPHKYFDLIAGSGTGAIQACMLGRMCMSVNSAIESYESFTKEVYSDKKWMGSESFKATTLKESLRKLVQRATGNPDQPMQEVIVSSGCKTLVFAMSNHTVRSNTPIAFRSYPVSALQGPQCSIWETLCATMAYPGLFKPFEIDGPPKWSFTGADLSCSNPLGHVLTEVKALYKDRHVASIISVGTGHVDTIQDTNAWRVPWSPPTAALVAMRSIAANNERVAEEMAKRFSSVENVYFRLSVDQGTQGVGMIKWEQLNEVAEHTQAYMRLSEIDQRIDQVTKAVRARGTRVGTVHIDGGVPIIKAPKLTIDGTCPAPAANYTGCEKKILSIKSCVLSRDSVERSVCIVHGLGGAGKTQLVLKVIERTREEWEDVIYIDASTRDSIEANLQGVSTARKVGDTHIHTLRWLESRHDRWLLVFDNADDPALRLRDYFPGGSHGSIIVTTRLYGMTVLAHGVDSKCHVLSMDPDDALLLLLRSAQKQEQELSIAEDESAKALLEDIGNLALAIVHAGSFIGQTPHMTFIKYRALLAQKQRQTLEAYNNLPLAVKTDSYEHTVYTVWRMCYDRLGSKAQELLWLMAYMHHSGIDLDIFRRASSNLASRKPTIPTTQVEDASRELIERFLSYFMNESGSWDELAFTQVVNEISSHSLLGFDQTSGTYRMHVLVQDWACTVIYPEDRPVAECTRALLSLSIPYDNDLESIEFRRSLGLHVNKAQSSGTDGAEVSHSRAFAEVYRERGQWGKAEELQKQLRERSKQVLGDRHPHTLRNMNNLALTYRDLGRLEEARALQVEVLDAYKQVLGDRHPDTLTSMNNLALTYRDLGRLEEARALQVEVLDARKQVLGDRHPDTLRSMSNLALTYGDLGRLEEARALQVEVLDARKQVLGDRHPDTLTSMNNLALTYGDLGRLEEARALQVEVLDARKQVLGDRHPDTLTSMNNLALTYGDLGRLEEARALQVEVLDARKQVLGDRHPDTLTSMNNLALTYGDLGRLEEARALQVEVLDARKQVLGDRHPDTLTSMNNLALTYGDLGRLEEARALQVEVLDARKQVLGDRHPDTLKSMNNLALTYRDLGRLEEARALQVEVLDATKQVLGDRHPDTLTSMNNLAGTYGDLGRLEEARALQVEVLDARKQVLGDRHPDTLTSMNNLAGTYGDLGRLEEARALQVEELDATKQVLGDRHPHTLNSMNNLAHTYLRLSRLHDAQALFIKAFEGRKHTLGVHHPDTLSTMSSLASTYLDLGLWEDAEKLHMNTDIYSQTFGEDHGETEFAYEQIERIRTCREQRAGSPSLQ
ncbi:Patatin-like phospholipase, partial [Rhizoctonia solani]